MPQERNEWLDRIKAIEREYRVTRVAIDRLRVAAAADPTILHQVAVRDVRQASERLEGTYLIRLFAEFEAGLRVFLRAVHKRRPPSRTQDLINSVASRQRIPNVEITRVHAVRDYRNALVHERDETTTSISVADARADLCRFFRYLPPTW